MQKQISVNNEGHINAGSEDPVLYRLSLVEMQTVTLRNLCNEYISSDISKCMGQCGTQNRIKM